MALLFADGFDQYANRLDMAKGYWNSNTGGGTSVLLETTVVRNGGQSLELDGAQTSAYLAKTVSSANNTYIIGFALYPVTLLDHDNFIQFFAGGQSQGFINIKSTGTIEYVNGDIQSQGISTSAVSQGVWNYIELKITFHATTGVVVIKVNENEVLNVTAKDTVDNSGPNSIDSIRFTARTNNATTYIDDVYICDTTGTLNNDFLGDVRVDAILPDGDSAVAWTRSAGANNFELVDETLPDDDTTYVYSSTATQQDLYNYAALPGDGDTVFGVIPIAYCRKEDTGGRGVKLLTKDGANNQASAAKYMSSSYAWKWDVFETYDGANAWTVAKVDGGQFGIELV